MPQLSPAQFENIRELVARNPAMAGLLIRQIAGANPGLVQQLGEDQFIAGILGLAAGEEGGENDEEDPVPPGAHVVNVTPEERAAIERVRVPHLSRQKEPPTLQIFLNRSWRLLDSPGSRLSKLTLHAIRTRSWPPTISLTVISNNNCIPGGAMLDIVSLACFRYVLDFVRPTGSSVLDLPLFKASTFVGPIIW